MAQSGQKILNVGLIGLGAAGAPVARAVATGAAGHCRLAAVLVRGASLSAARALVGHAGVATTDPDEFFRQSLDVVVETAGQETVRAYAARSLAAGADFMLISAGALNDDAFREGLTAAAAAAGRRVLVAAGAMMALDGVAAAAVGKVEKVLHIARKPPRAWKDTEAEGRVDLDRLQEPVMLYEGTARESAVRFPANVNVQAAVALAGIGLDRTQVQVVADPTVVRNTHELVVRGEFGEFRLVFKSIPSGNPKTGILTAQGVIKAIRNLTSPLVIGV